MFSSKFILKQKLKSQKVILNLSIILFYLFNLLYKYLNPATVGSARTNAKEREKKEGKVRKVKKRKGIEAMRVKHPTPSQAIDALIGDGRKHNRNQKKEKERKRDQIPNPTTLGHSSPPTTQFVCCTSKKIFPPI